MDLIHDRGSMDPVHESGPWTWTVFPNTSEMSQMVFSMLWKLV